MRTVLGILARLVCWAVGGLAAFVAIVCVVNLVHPDEPDSRIGAAVMLVAALAVIAGCAWALRRTPRLLTPTADRSSDEVVEADRRRRAGEAVVLRPGRRRTITLMLVSLAFAGTAVWGFVTSPNVVLALAAVLMGAAAGVFALRMVPGRMYLRIDPDGVLVHGPFRPGGGAGTTSGTSRSPRPRCPTAGRRSSSASPGATPTRGARAPGRG